MKKINSILVSLFLGITSIMAQSPLNSLNFDGSNDYISSSLPTVFNDIPNNDFTIEAWIKPNGNAFSRVVYAQQNSTNFASISLNISNFVYFYVSNVVGVVSASSLPFGVWSHVACTWDASSSSVEIYINGVLQSSSAGGSSSTGNDNVMTIGSRTNGAQYFMGELDELRIWDRIRTSCEISAAMNSEFTVSQANLVAYYNFNQGVAGGSNIGITSLPDFTTNYNGSLINFGLTSNISNWVSSGANITSVNQGNGVFTGIDTRTECNSYTWIDGNTYSANNNSATFNIVGGAANGCDSLVTLDLTINNSTSGTDTRTECNSYTWIDGNTYSANNNSAIFNIVGGAANGCDSLVTLDLTINNSTSGTDTRTECNSYTWIDGNTYSANNNSATFNIVGGAANGCDSLVTLDLTINNSTSGTDTRTECNSYTWIDGNTYSANNNSATFNIVGGAANGCDSLVTLDLTINNSTSGTDTRTECNSYTWIDGNTYSTSNNSATFNIVGGAANGCDSLVTLNLTINTVSDLTTSTSGVTITANNSNATYQWLDCTNSNAIITGEISQSFTATANGNYAVELTENGCVDTSVCIAITSVGILENSFGNAIKVYPNPTIGKLSIDLGGLYPSILVIVNNELGQETLKKMYMNRNMIELTIDGEKGIYFVHVYAESKSAILKVIKE
ncbi:MAG: T9SS type A sorting domain-containing protein [Bacteroidetes bacterium]|nr:T9SS type A sorting domain-containing protein [Bacteroidota bacterium]